MITDDSGCGEVPDVNNDRVVLLRCGSTPKYLGTDNAGYYQLSKGRGNFLAQWFVTVIGAMLAPHIRSGHGTLVHWLTW